MYFFITLVLIFLVFHFWLKSRRFQHSGEFLSNQFDETSQVLESLHDGLIECDSQMVPVRVNHAIEMMLGVEANMIINRTIEQGVSNSAIDKSLSAILFPEKGKESAESYDVFLTAPRELKLRVFTVPKTSPHTHNNTGYIKIVRDVTIETIVEQHKNDLISIVSHQLLTPLTGMKWIFKGLLAGDMGPMNDKQTDMVKRGTEANESMIDLVTDILDATKVEQARFTYKIEEKKIADLVHEMVVSRHEKAAARGVEIVESLSAKDKLLHFDVERLGIALGNIIDNAVDYSPKGAKVEVGMTPLGDGVAITVTDHGIGIAEKDKSKLYNKFYRAENAKRVRTTGTGLGLYLAKHIIDDHGGKIDLRSTEGSGTTFTITLPGSVGTKAVGQGVVASI